MTVSVLVVDDSASMQMLIKAVLEQDPEISVVGVAGDAQEARSAIKELNPDVVTLDVEMPGMNGLQFLEKIMTLRPMPVVMISSHTSKGADASIEALMNGAVSCLLKPRIDDVAALEEMRAVVKQAAFSKPAARVKAFNPGPASVPCSPTPSQEEADLIVIGASTGGVEALTTLFAGFPENCPPTVVVQHMPANFTASFASRLNDLFKQDVCEVQDYQELRHGQIYIAPGSVGHTTIKHSGTLRACVRNGDPVMGHIPAVDLLFESAAEVLGPKAKGVLLTGMGSDGAKGMLKMKDANARTIAQDEESCLIYGMPGSAVKLGAATHVLPLNQIAGALFGQHH